MVLNLGKPKKKKKRQVCFTLDEELIREMEEIREKTGVSVSTQIELKLRGYEIIKKEK